MTNKVARYAVKRVRVRRICVSCIFAAKKKAPPEKTGPVSDAGSGRRSLLTTVLLLHPKIADGNLVIAGNRDKAFIEIAYISDLGHEPAATPTRFLALRSNIYFVVSLIIKRN